jgi:hypothetical protein
MYKGHVSNEIFGHPTELEAFCQISPKRFRREGQKDANAKGHLANFKAHSSLTSLFNTSPTYSGIA